MKHPMGQASTWTFLLLASGCSAPPIILIRNGLPSPFALAPVPEKTLAAGQRLEIPLSFEGRADIPSETSFTCLAGKDFQCPEGLAIDDATGVLTWTPTAAQAHRTWHIRILATHARRQAETSFAVSVHSLSFLAAATLAPDEPRPASVLTCAPLWETGLDPGTVRTTFRWFVDGTVVEGQTNAAFVATGLRKGQKVSCEISATDAFNNQRVETSPEVALGNTPPIAAVRLTSANTEAGLELTCDASETQDADGDALSLFYQWKMDGSLIVNQSGRTLTGSVVRANSNISCVFFASDGQGDFVSAESETMRIPNRLPTAVAQLTPLSPNRGSTLQCLTSASHDPDGDGLTFEYSWKQDGALIAHQSAATLLPGTAANGARVVCLAKASDGHGGTHEVTSNEVTIQNRPPAAAVETDPAAVVLPEAAYRNVELTCSTANIFDPDGDALTFAYSWKKGNGNILSGHTAATLPALTLNSGESVFCEARATDATGAAVTFTSPTKTLENRNPVAAPQLTANQTPATASSILTCNNASTDPDGDTLFVQSFAWKVNGTVVPDQAGSTLAAPFFANGDVVACRLTVADGKGGTHAADSESLVIQNRAPTAAASLSPALPNRSQTLTCSATGSSDPDNDTLTFSYVWTQNGSPLAGQTAATLPPDTAANGATVACLVTASDGHGGTATATSPPVILQNRDPVLGSVQVSPNPARRGDVLECEANGVSDPDGDTLTTTYVWRENGVVLAGKTAATLAAHTAANGSTVNCTAAVSDGRGGLVAVTAPDRILQNTPPVATAVIAPTTAYVTTPLTCSTSGSSDPDGDTLAFTYVWKRNGAVIPSAVSSTLDPGSSVQGQQIACEATANDGRGGTHTAASSPVTIANRAPTLAAVSLPSPAYRTSALVCTPVGGSDPDGDTLTYAFEWKKNGAPVGDATASLAPGHFTTNDEISCRAKAQDPKNSESAWSDPASTTIANRVPVVTLAVMTPADPQTTTTSLACDATASDADGDTLAYTFRLKKNGTVAQTSGPTASDSAAFAIAGPDLNDQFWCEIVASDGIGESDIFSTSKGIVGVVPPTFTAGVSPAAGDGGTTFTCSAQDVVANGHTIAWTYQWRRNGNTIPGATGASLAPGALAHGDALTCALTANYESGGTTTQSSSPLTVANRAPVAAAAVSPATPHRGQALTCSPAGSMDPDGDTLSYSYAWSENGVPLVGQTAATLPANSVANGASVRCTVTANDSQGANNTHAATSSAIVIQNRNPVPTAAVSPATPHRDQALTCQTTGSADPDGDTLAFTYVWKQDGTVLADQTAAILPAATASNGKTVTCEATASDGKGGVVTAVSAGVLIQNRAPTLTASVTPATPTRIQVLTCNLLSPFDADGDTLTYSYVWKQNGTTLTSQISATLPAHTAANGSSVHCEVTANDGKGGVTTATAAAVTIANTLPSVAAAILPAAPHRGEVLSCQTTGSSDPDGDALAFSYVWKQNNVVLAGQTAATLPANTASNGASIVCEATGNDGHGGSVTATSAAVTVQNRAPTVAAAITPATAHRGQVLTCSTTGSSDPDGDTLTFTYLWKQNGSAIDGQTASTLPANTAANGSSIRCEATGSDGKGGSVTTASAALLIQNCAPTLAVAVTPATPHRGEVLTCSTAGSADPDGDTLTYTYVWKQNATAMPGQTAATLPANTASNGASITCEATGNDGQGSTVLAASTGVTIQNRNPTVVASVSASTPNLDATLTCVTTLSADPDGDTLTFTYVWKRNTGTVVAGQTAATLLSGNFANGDTVWCEASASDGHGGFALGVAPSVAIQNRTPTAAAAIAEATIYRSTALTCSSTGSSDPDGDALTYAFAWKRNGSLLEGQTAATLPANTLTPDDAVVCTVTASDGKGGTHVATSAAKSVTNRAPTAAASVGPASPTKGDTLTCSASGSSDPDGDTLTYSYAWTRNAGTVAGQTASTLVLSSYNVGDVFACKVTANDGRSANNLSTVATSAAVTIQNRAPIAAATVATNETGTPVTSPINLWQTLYCNTNGTSDPDGHPLTYTYVWKKNGAVIAGATTNSLDRTKFRYTNQIQCVATVKDNQASNHTTVATSATLTIPNANCDFNGDGMCDLVWRRHNQAMPGSDPVWLMNTSMQVIQRTTLAGGTVTPAGWSINGVADFTGDGKPDILWYNYNNYATHIWEMNGLSRNAVHVLSFTGGPGWHPVGAEDLTGDGKPDIAWWNNLSGEFSYWQMDGINCISATTITNLGTSYWPDTIADIDGDGKADVVWRETTSKNLGWWKMNGTSIVSAHGFLGGGSIGDYYAYGDDFNNDGRADLLFHVWNPAAGYAGNVSYWILNAATNDYDAALGGLLDPSFNIPYDTFTFGGR